MRRPYVFVNLILCIIYSCKKTWGPFGRSHHTKYTKWYQFTCAKHLYLWVWSCMANPSNLVHMQYLQHWQSCFGQFSSHSSRPHSQKTFWLKTNCRGIKGLILWNLFIFNHTWRIWMALMIPRWAVKNVITAHYSPGRVFERRNSLKAKLTLIGKVCCQMESSILSTNGLWDSHFSTSPVLSAASPKMLNTCTGILNFWPCFTPVSTTLIYRITPIRSARLPLYCPNRRYPSCYLYCPNRRYPAVDMMIMRFVW